MSFCSLLSQEVVTPLLVLPVEVAYSTSTAVMWTDVGYICSEGGRKERGKEGREGRGRETEREWSEREGRKRRGRETERE